ncbi:MAG: protein kinase [Chloroflexi bacterium]|nr:protein kinase [Chloroflexota bacterium]
MPDDRFKLQGNSLDRYEVLELIGQGGTCSVYKANDPKLGRDVALKVLPPERTSSEAFIERFRREARAVARLSHPNILKVHDYGEDGEFAFLVTELVPGGTLYLQLGRAFTIEEMLKIVTPLADALDYAHGEGIVHSDLKPSNVLLDGANRPILGDFGLVRLLKSSTYASSETSVFGTPEYMAPEVVLGEPPVPASDIYALGVLVYEMLLTRPPFIGETRVATATAHVKQALEFPKPDRVLHIPALDKQVQQAIVKALHKQPNQRYEKASDFVAALSKATGTVEKPRSNLVQFPSAHVKAHDNLSDSERIKVFLVEDHAFVLDALKLLIEDEDSLLLVGEATSAEAALEKIDEIKPEVMVMDITLPGMNGIEATRKVKTLWPEIHVLMLSGYGEQYIADAIAAGADGYIMKTADTGQVVKAIHEVYEGGSPIDLNLAKSLFKKVAETTTS